MSENPRIVRVGIIDSGLDLPSSQCASFYPDGRNVSGYEPPKHDHGRIIASMIAGERIELYSAKVFHDTLTTTPEQIATAIGHLSRFRPDIIHMSLGTVHDRPAVRIYCERYLANGGIVVASIPTQGSQEVYPAAYNGVIRVCADGRCPSNRWSITGSEPIRFGASPLSGHPIIRGSSVAAARISGHIARFLLEGGQSSDVVDYLCAKALR